MAKYKALNPIVGSPWENLIAAVIAKTVTDLAHGSKRERRDALYCIQDQWFDQLCQSLNLSPDYVREQAIGCL